MKSKIIVKLIGLLICISVVACDIPESRINQEQLEYFNASPRQYSHVWERLKRSFKLKSAYPHSRNRHYIKKYTSQSHHLVKLSQRATPYIFYITSEIEKRNMPGELALLPMIESGFLPYAKSHVDAQGIWQIDPITGKEYKLHKNKWYDARRDILASTKAALDHLEMHYKSFNNDWLLALAAYNCGGGGVRKAIRQNQRLGKPTDYWSLPLPKQTRHFVPKLLALAHLVTKAEDLGINLELVHNKPYFASVNLDRQLSLHQIASYAGVNLAEVKRLNPGYNLHVTHPRGPHTVLLPSNKIATFNNNYKSKNNRMKYKAPLIKNGNNYSYVIQPGDSLAIIAKRYKVTLNDLMAINNINNVNLIVAGKKLIIPGAAA